MPSVFQQMARQVYGAEPYSLTGKIENIVGMSIEASGGRAAVGDICRIYNGDSGGQVTAEVVGFKNDHILLMPYSDMNGISAGNFVRNTGRQLTLQVGEFLRGRIINALGQPIDGKGPFEGGSPYCVGGNYINPLQRPPIRERIQFGVKAIDGMITIGKGQRIGIFAGSGVGKSTLMNLLSKSDVFAENKLFATLDTTVRKVIIDNLPFLLTDTVGFIRKLPTHLVESFKSTLDEVRDADLLLHVVDISHPNFEEQIEVVNRTLADVCDGAEKPMIMVFNKIDAFTYTPKDEDDLTERTRENVSLDELKETWMNRMGSDAVFISAKKGINIDELKQKIYEKAKEIHLTRFPYNDFLFQKYDSEDFSDQ